MKKVSFLCCVLLLSGAWAGEDGESLLEQLQSLNYGNYAEKIEGIAKAFNRHLSYRKKICTGELSSLVFKNSREQAPEEERKLSRQERRDCLQQVGKLQKRYIEASFAKRVEFLESVHQERMEGLRRQKDRALAAIKDS